MTEDDDIEDDLVPITACVYSHEAHILRGVLESHGVDAYLHNEFLTNMYIFFGSVGGYVRLFVHTNDVDEARRLLANVPETQTAKEAPPRFSIKYGGIKALLHFCTYLVFGLPPFHSYTYFVDSQDDEME